MSAERGDALVAPRCPGGEYSLIPSLCTSLLGSSKTPNGPKCPILLWGCPMELQCVWWACSRHLAADKVCISCSAWKGFAAIPFLVTGLHSPWCMQWGVCIHPIACDQFAPTIVHAMSLHPSRFSCPIACDAFAPAAEGAVVLHPTLCLGSTCTHHCMQ